MIARSRRSDRYLLSEEMPHVKVSINCYIGKTNNSYPRYIEIINMICDIDNQNFVVLSAVRSYDRLYKRTPKICERWP
jgi:hypothetical protein